ncbi:DUF3558 domain-containing protein [Rhodococcus sp. CH91]|uniref:DUF3558 domain-containing protein n=1 Tax=Rhodococcus sp. CH91 TaxID=2910256 RepID=UPI001F4AC988|nr:DUF3558 domain-containing protein [Rhodococcus sp. CH91]
MGKWGTVALAVAAVVVTACSPSAADDLTDDEAATSTTRTPRITDDSGRPPVTFDPCYDIPDDVMNAAGYDAGKKELADMPMGTYTFLGCTYRDANHIPGVRRGYGINVLSGNVTVAEELEKNGHISSSTRVNGRAALLRIDPSQKATCTYVLQTDFGIVIFNRIEHVDSLTDPPIDEWCQGFEQLVASVEPYLP